MVGDEMKTIAMIAGLFVAFAALTAVVVIFTVSQLKSYLDREHHDRLVIGGNETASKEEVIRRYAEKWGFSKAELDVAIFASKGFSNVEIAEMRGSAVATVKTQLSHIFRKSGLENRYQLMAFVTDEVCLMAGRNAAENTVSPETAPVAKAPKSGAVVPLVAKRKSIFSDTFHKSSEKKIAVAG